MTGEELQTKLYQRMTAEQEQYRNWLLGQPPADILNHAAEYTVREDIVMEMSALELPEAHTRALLRSKTPRRTFTRSGTRRKPTTWRTCGM